ncbi:peptidase M3A/M3B [Fadolivirus algeromassiliense]|jgi:Zn-dependent oligopeptidase|uniref:Peptidase M3A/M3B n=1 Tax=Fadolivirus FV1/VV64 TaxID=3070911 RepID=A0A7D3V7N0_9VIRU|nr:peptidase M3A/M3B [Fadolivirus algeromassiliense]QKF94196.1 peptidase M3A/M3B [Fadolivirus FV1/VV64]
MEPGFTFTNITPDTIMQYKLMVILQINMTLTSIIDLKDTRTFANTIQPLINVMTNMEPYKSIFHYITNFYPQKELRDSAQEAEKEIKKFMIDTFLRKDLYNALSEYYNGGYMSEMQSLTHEEQRYVEHQMRDFRRNGLHLDDENYNAVKSMLKELSDLSTKYQNNLNEDTTSFKFTKEDLDGIPSHWFNDDKIVKDLDGNNTEYYKVTLKYPDYIPVMDYVKSDAVRKQMFTAYNSRCAKENTEILTKAIELRYSIAKILGYKNYADYGTEVKVIKNGQNALDFEHNMNEKFTPLYRKDMDMLLNFARTKSQNPINKEKLDSWDLRYYNRELTESECDINMEEVRKYFPLDVVKQGLFNIYQNLLGLVFTEVSTANKWHDEVTLYRVNDKQTNETLGYFYLDLHPRDGKYGHAAAFDFMTGCDMTKITGENTRRPHIMAVACNFPKDGCIEFDEVETFFHEFGHVMHQICSRPQLTEFSGFGVEWDFVEAPSQFLEYFVYTINGLSQMSKHTETNQTVPQELVEKLNKKKNFLAGYFYKRQLVFGLADLKMHTLTDFSEPVDIQEIWYGVEHDVLEIDNNTKLYPFASFGHLMGGYQSTYYGYLRAETYAANIFYKLFKNDPLNPEIGMRYRKKLLEPGSSKDALELLEDLLGEKPNDDYFLKEKGLI